MSHHIRIRPSGKYMILFVGSGRVLVPAFRALGVRRQWDPEAKGWLVGKGPAQDLIAYLEHRGGVLIDLEQVQA